LQRGGEVESTIALAWLWAVDGVRPDRWDYLGVSLCLAGMAVGGGRAFTAHTDYPAGMKRKK